MKVEKMLIIIMMTCSLLLASSNHVTAAEQTGILEDAAGDVVGIDLMEMTQDIVTENEYIDVENIDIVKVEYTITDETIYLTLQVAEGAIIEDRGSYSQLEMDDPDATSFNADVIAYSFTLETSENTYTVIYINNTCQVTSSLGNTTNLTADTDFSVSKNVLTFSFNWDTTDETFEEITASTQYSRMIFDMEYILNLDPEDENWEDLGFVSLMDQVPNGPLFAYADATNLGEVGSPIEFEGIVLDGYPPYDINWAFGDGETSTEKNPTHVYDTAGEYEYTLTVTDAEGTSESSSGDIEIAAGEDDDTPGFELMIAIGAIGFIFLWKRKR